MQMQNQKQVNRKKIKKSQILLLGSLLVFVGICTLSFEYLGRMKDDVFTDMDLKLNAGLVVADDEEATTDVPITNNLPEDNKQVVQAPVIDYSKYLGVLEIPKVGLKRGFYNLDSKYNDIQYNVTLVEGSNMPDVVNGNLILMAHSGDAAVSYFAYLYILKIGDKAYVTYNGNKYTYQIVNIYDVPKTGRVKIVRSYDKTTLTLITCTKNNDKSQTVYILELV
ncbi:MAG: sortase [Bacilli bacterium]|nr:sortase [Bacilli bacterium]